MGATSPFIRHRRRVSRKKAHCRHGITRRRTTSTTKGEHQRCLDRVPRDYHLFPPPLQEPPPNRVCHPLVIKQHAALCTASTRSRNAKYRRRPACLFIEPARSIGTHYRTGDRMAARGGRGRQPGRGKEGGSEGGREGGKEKERGIGKVNGNWWRRASHIHTYRRGRESRREERETLTNEGGKGSRKMFYPCAPRCSWQFRFHRGRTG